MRNKCIMFIICLVLLAAFMGFAETKGKTGGLLGKDFALIFNLPTLIDADNYSDGFQQGGGAKLWITDTLALRLLIHLYHQTINETEISVTDIGLSGAIEYHFAPRILSPYVGALLGVLLEMETEMESLLTVYFGGLIGVEFQLHKNISLFGEYNLIVTLYDWGYSINFGTLAEAQVGILFYF